MSPDPSVTHQSSSSGRATEEDDWSDDRLLDEVLSAVGLTSGKLPTHWMPPASTMHVARWRTELKLSGPQIVSAARASRANFPDPPNGPLGLDGVMRRVAAELSAPALAPTASAPPRGQAAPESRDARRARWEKIGRTGT